MKRFLNPLDSTTKFPEASLVVGQGPRIEKKTSDCPSPLNNFIKSSITMLTTSTTSTTPIQSPREKYDRQARQLEGSAGSSGGVSTSDSISDVSSSVKQLSIHPDPYAPSATFGLLNITGSFTSTGESTTDWQNIGQPSCESSSVSWDELKVLVQHHHRAALSASQEDVNVSHVLQDVMKTVSLDYSTMTCCGSVGGILHNEGFCKPCVFANKAANVCRNGKSCMFCHHSHKERRGSGKGRRVPQSSTPGRCVDGVHGTPLAQRSQGGPCRATSPALSRKPGRVDFVSSVTPQQYPNASTSPPPGFGLRSGPKFQHYPQMTLGTPATTPFHNRGFATEPAQTQRLIEKESQSDADFLIALQRLLQHESPCLLDVESKDRTCMNPFVLTSRPVECNGAYNSEFLNVLSDYNGQSSTGFHSGFNGYSHSGYGCQPNSVASTQDSATFSIMTRNGLEHGHLSYLQLQSMLQ